MTYEELRERLHAAGGEHGRGASAQDIAAAEGALDVELPGNIRRFLEDFGWFRIAGGGIYGLGDDVPSDLDLVEETRGERERFRPLMPAYLLPLHNDGLGNHPALDLSRVAGDDAPVVLWDHEEDEDQEPAEEAGSFVEWLAELLEDAGK